MPWEVGIFQLYHFLGHKGQRLWTVSVRTFLAPSGSVSGKLILFAAIARVLLIGGVLRCSTLEIGLNHHDFVPPYKYLYHIQLDVSDSQLVVVVKGSLAPSPSSSTPTPTLTLGAHLLGLETSLELVILGGVHQWNT